MADNYQDRMRILQILMKHQMETTPDGLSSCSCGDFTSPVKDVETSRNYMSEHVANVLVDSSIGDVAQAMLSLAAEIIDDTKDRPKFDIRSDTGSGWLEGRITAAKMVTQRAKKHFVTLPAEK